MNKIELFQLQVKFLEVSILGKVGLSMYQTSKILSFLHSQVHIKSKDSDPAPLPSYQEGGKQRDILLPLRKLRVA